MHLNANEREMNPSTNLTSLSSTTSCSTTSTDSGVVIIDNRATFNRQGDADADGDNYKDKANEKTNNKINHNNIEITKDKQETEENLATRNSTKRSDSIKLINPATNRTSINIEHTININGNQNEQQQQQQQQSQRQRRNTSKSYSPTSSIRSTTISIISIDEHGIDSSVIDSDSEIEADAEGEHANYTVKKLGQQVTYPPNSPEIPAINQGLKVISQQVRPNGFANGDISSGGGLPANLLNGNLYAVATPTSTLATPGQANGPQIGSIALSNSTDVTFGDKHFYEGPVTIQQFVIDSREKWKAQDGENGDGHDNPNYTGPTTNGGAGYKMYQTRDEPPAPSLPRVLNRKAVWITTVFVLSSIIIGAVIATTTSLFEVAAKPKSKQVHHQLDDDEDSRQNIPINSTIDTEDEVFNGTLKMFDYADWGGRPPKQTLDKMKSPAHRVIISHTATESCNTTKVCIYRVRIIQAFHMDSFGWDDIGYSFVIGGDGFVYVGRGWNKVGAHTKGYNVDSIGVAFIGTFTKMEPTANQLTAAKLLLEEGVRLGKIVPDYKLFGARQLGATESPGEMLYKIIKKWPNWSTDI